VYIVGVKENARKEREREFGARFGEHWERRNQLEQQEPACVHPSVLVFAFKQARFLFFLRAVLRE